MAVEKKFLKKAVNDLRVKAFLENELRRAGVSSIELQKTPIATRVTLYVAKPGVVVGKKGKAIQDVSAALTQKFGIENPQLEVVEVHRPDLDAKLVAERIGRQIEMRGKVKQVLRFTLKDIMAAGAIGAEIIIAGKLVGKGGKARTFRARSGYLKKSGEMTKLVRQGRYTAYLKAGAIGIKVKIVPPGTVFPDKIDARAIVIPDDILQAAAQQAAALPAAEAVQPAPHKRPAGKPRARRPKPLAAPGTPSQPAVQPPAPSTAPAPSSQSSTAQPATPVSPEPAAPPAQTE